MSRRPVIRPTNCSSVDIEHLKRMSENRKAGDIGEGEVVQLVPCPNCGKELMRLPPNYPLYDIQCTGCSFRAQVRSEEHTSELQSQFHLVCRLLLEKKN